MLYQRPLCYIMMACFLALLFVGNPSAAPSDAAPTELPSAESLLELIETGTHQFSYVGTRMISIWLPDTTISHEERVLNHASGRRYVFPTTPRMRGRRGGNPFVQSVQDIRIERKLLMQNYRVDVSASEPIAGRPTYQLHIVSYWEGRPSKKLWIDVERGTVLRMEHYDAEGMLRSMFVFSTITYDEALVQAEMERFTEKRSRPPSRPEADRSEPDRPDRGRFGQGAQGAEGQRFGQRGNRPEWHQVEDPTSLEKIVGGEVLFLDPAPKGFVFREAEWMEWNDQIHVQLKYTDGLIPMVLFQRQQRGGFLRQRRSPGPPPGIEAQQFEIADTRVRLIDAGLVRITEWNKNERNYTLISELSQAASLSAVTALLKR